MKNKLTYDALFAGEESVIPKQGEKVIIVGGTKMLGKKRTIVIENSVWENVLELSRRSGKKISNIVNGVLIKYFEETNNKVWQGKTCQDWNIRAGFSCVFKG